MQRTCSLLDSENRSVKLVDRRSSWTNTMGYFASSLRWQQSEVRVNSRLGIVLAMELMDSCDQFTVRALFGDISAMLPAEPVPCIAPDLPSKCFKGKHSSAKWSEAGRLFAAGVKLVWFIDPAIESQRFTKPRRAGCLSRGELLIGVQRCCLAASCRCEQLFEQAGDDQGASSSRPGAARKFFTSFGKRAAAAPSTRRWS